MITLEMRATFDRDKLSGTSSSELLTIHRILSSKMAEEGLGPLREVEISEAIEMVEKEIISRLK